MADKITLHTLVQDTLTSGKAPSEETIKSLTLTHTASDGRKTGLQREGIRRSLRKHLAALAELAATSQDAREIEEAADAIESRFGQATADREDPAELASRIERNPQGRSQSKRQDFEARHRLQEAIAWSAQNGSPLDSEEMADSQLAPDEDLTPQQAQEWRSAVRQASKRAVELWRQGNQGGAQQWAAKAAGELAGQMARPKRHDPSRGVHDPAALARLVPRSGGTAPRASVRPAG